MISKQRLLVGLALGLLLVLGLVALWFLLRAPGAGSEAAGEARPERAVEPFLLGLALTSESTRLFADAPLFLQVDLRARATPADVPPPASTFGTEADAWWAGLRILLDPGTGEERHLAFDVLQPREPVRIDLAQQSAFLALAIAPNTLGAGAHTLGARFEPPGEVAARSNEIDLEMEAAAPRPDRALLLARYHLELDQPDQALASLDAIADTEVSAPDFYALRGDALEMQGDLPGAIEAYSRAIEMVARSSEERLEPPTYYLRRRRELMGLERPRGQP
jgi:tetratricopeptide (TPR) repeat protein